MRHAAAIIAAAVITALWTLSLAGVLEAPTGWLYDRMVDWTPSAGAAVQPVVVVETPVTDFLGAEQIWLPLLDTLEAYGAKAVAFSAMPPRAPEAFYEQALRHGNVVFGLQVANGASGTPPRLLPPPPNAAAKPLLYAPAPLPPSLQGASRRTYVRFEAGGVLYPALTRQAAALFTGAPLEQDTYPSLLDLAAGAEFSPEVPLTTPDPVDRLLMRLESQGFAPHGTTVLVNFTGKANALPRFGADRLLAGDVLPAMIKDRAVLVGPQCPPGAAGLHTPLAGQRGAMSPLEFHGYAIRSLIANDAIHRLGPVALLGTIAGVYLLSLAVFRRSGTRVFPWSFAALLMAEATAVYLALALAGWWLPGIEMGLATLLPFVYVARTRTLAEEDVAHAILADATARLREQRAPQSFYSSEEYWQQIITMVYQTLDLERTIFLARVERDHRVHEVQALNCSIEDIHERRRDYERTPYSTAIQEGGPIVIAPNRPFLEPGRPNENQYLVPLVFAGQVLGFWAFGIDRDRAAAVPMLDAVLRSFGAQISEVLYRRRQWLEQQRQARGGLRRLAPFEDRRGVLDESRRAVALLERRLITLESVLEGLNTGAIVYDMFGRVVQMSRKMGDLLHETGIDATKMTAADLAAALTQQPHADIRRGLRDVILDGETVTLPATALPGSELDYMLSLSAIRVTGEEAEEHEAFPFEVLGIMVQLLDVSDLRRQIGLKQKLLTNITFRLRHDMQGVLLAFSLLAQEDLDLDTRDEVETLLRERSGSMLWFLRRVQKHLARDVLRDGADNFPIDAREIVLATIDALDEDRRVRNITMEVNIPEFPQLVWASPGGFRDVCEAMLRLLLEDTADGNQVRVHWDEDEETSTLEFSDDGFGIPPDVLNRYLYTDAATASRDFGRLRALLPQVARWQATFEAASAVGAGMKFTLRLRRFV